MTSYGIIRPVRLHVGETDAKVRLKARNTRFGSRVQKAQKVQKKYVESDIRQLLQDTPIELFKCNEWDSAETNVVLLEGLARIAEMVKSLEKEVIQKNDIYEEIFNRVLPCRNHDDSRVRSVVIRILALLATSDGRVYALFQHNIHVMAIRAMELSAFVPEEERIESLKLISHIYHTLNHSARFKEVILEHNQFELFLRCSLKCILTVAMSRFKVPLKAEKSNAEGRNEPKSEMDRLTFAALGVLLEFSVNDPLTILDNIGTNWLINTLNGLGASHPRISGLIHRLLAHWLDCPTLREKAELHLVLAQMFAPLVDLGFFQHHPKDMKHTPRFVKICENMNSSAKAIIHNMSTWPGLLACMAIDNTTGKLHESSPLRIVQYLGIQSVTSATLCKLRDIVVDLCCDFVGRPYGSKQFANWIEARNFYAKMHMPDAYKCSLRDEFIVAEMSAWMASGEPLKDQVDLLFGFRAVACYGLIAAGLPEALCRLILLDSSAYLPREWRLKTLAVPNLVQSAAQSFMESADPETKEMLGQYSSSQRRTGQINSKQFDDAIILLDRLDQLDKINQERGSLLRQLHNTNLFLLPVASGIFQEGSKLGFDETVVESVFSSISNKLYIDTSSDYECPAKPPLNWKFIDQTLQILEADSSPMHKSSPYSDKCHLFFQHISSHFLPSNENLARIGDSGDFFSVNCGRRAYALMVSQLPNSFYAEILENFAIDCCKHLDQATMYSGTFAPKNILSGGAAYHFAIIRAISSQDLGYRILEKTALFQV
ncbi:rapamycin-insensitive companion of mTOR, n-term domain-containing protein [Ditylenchus destructor]|uniref:Rapamycin-insensitive companion of mTOR, n-term domain-containing protein n=1 Tax=Ditylenchus destructor TaxID=166010 RepID=A0AAD4MWE0_9BILA|nr:rapamycin-insensitive companion of mTOR, n-term domain-containing protein [Ditylenchus destructor]